jgi:hypothetical protein
VPNVKRFGGENPQEIQQLGTLVLTTVVNS